MKNQLLIIFLFIVNCSFADNCSKLVDSVMQNYHANEGLSLNIGYPKNLEPYAEICKAEILKKDGNIDIKMIVDNTSSNVHYDINKSSHNWWQFWK